MAYLVSNAGAGVTVYQIEVDNVIVATPNAEADFTVHYNLSPLNLQAGVGHVIRARRSTDGVLWSDWSAPLAYNQPTAPSISLSST